MSVYGIIPLHFQSAVHFGDAGEGGGLEDIYSHGKSDTLFSALYIEAIRNDKTLAQEFYEKCASGHILISDLFPWEEIEGEYYLYLPKPAFIGKGNTRNTEKSWDVMKDIMAKRKKNKKEMFLRASQLNPYISHRAKGEDYDIDSFSGGKADVRMHINHRTQEPYAVGMYSFLPTAGLYLIVAGKSEKDVTIVADLIQMVGYTGIGGRRSGGAGTFEPEDLAILEGDSIWGEDDVSIYYMLNNGRAGQQMSLSTFLPKREEEKIVERGRGQWIRRGGFSYDEQTETLKKMNSVYMMRSGACFSHRLCGRIADVSLDGWAHPVYKYGKGFFAGIEVPSDEI